MSKNLTNKRKIFNDPVHGFIAISDDLIYDLIEHPYFQRLRRISQTGLSNYVYPGAMHTRFHHALGCMHLMQLSIKVLRDKGIKISKEEERASLIAILLHDIGHGPFSHALEATLLDGVSHERLSLRLMEDLNREFSGELELAIGIFLNKYHRPFFHQLISSQLDVDRLDYLKRDSFYTGVSEGNVNSERIITMMNVADDELVIDGKGIYSIEKYLISRMFMYWQVYLHKTSVTAEVYLIETLKRAKKLAQEKMPLHTPDKLNYFLQKKDFSNLNETDIQNFSELDDTEILYSLKQWQTEEDKVLSNLSTSIIQRKLPHSMIRSEAISEENIQKLIQQYNKVMNFEGGNYFIHQNKLKVLPYDFNKNSIKLLMKNNQIVELQKTENQILTSDLKNEIVRYHICVPRQINSLFQTFL